MSILKLYGFTEEEQRALQQQVTAERCESGRLSELAIDSEAWVWVVRSHSHMPFREAVQSSEIATPRMQAVLWAPSGEDAPPFDEWGDLFEIALEADRTCDLALLQRIARCERVLGWNLRLEDLAPDPNEVRFSTQWERALALLPLSSEERSHLATCFDCRTQVKTWFWQEYSLRLELDCPSSDSLAKWLQEEDVAVATHLAGCADCREAARRQAWLWVETGDLTEEQARIRVATFGGQFVVDEASVWLQAILDWSRVQAIATFLVSVSPLLRRSRERGEASASPTVDVSAADDAEQRLLAGTPVILQDEEHWLQLRQTGNDLLIRAGQSTTQRYSRFRIEFRRDDTPVAAVESEAGVARLTPVHFESARAAGADRWVITDVAS